MHGLLYIYFDILLQYHASTLKKVEDLSSVHPLVDYTNPSLITLLPFQITKRKCTLDVKITNNAQLEKITTIYS